MARTALVFCFAVLMPPESSVGQKVIQPPESNGHRPPGLLKEDLRKTPGLPEKGEPSGKQGAEPDHVTRFDPRGVDLRFQDGRWLLWAGEAAIKDFARNESDARKALHLIRSLGFTEWATIGKPQPAFEYFLAGGKPPTATPLGLELSRFNPDRLAIKPHTDGWVLSEGPRPLFRFHERDQAERALALIKKHQFDRVGYVGRTQRTMMVLFTGIDQQLRPAELKVERPRIERPKLQRPNEGNLSRLPSRNDNEAGTRADKPPVPPVQTTRLPFDYRQVTVRKAEGEWKLMLGAYALKTFGENERDAREAMKVIQYYRFTEMQLFADGAGRPDAGNRFEFFLVQGKAPIGRMFGQESSLFEPQQAALRPHDGRWWITFHEQRLLPFADEAHAQHALETIRKHGFDQLCRVGNSDTGMMYFVKTR